jgi:hypothetical protein
MPVSFCRLCVSLQSFADTISLSSGCLSPRPPPPNTHTHTQLSFVNVDLAVSQQLGDYSALFQKTGLVFSTHPGTDQGPAFTGIQAYRESNRNAKRLVSALATASGCEPNADNCRYQDSLKLSRSGSGGGGGGAYQVTPWSQLPFEKQNLADSIAIMHIAPTATTNVDRNDLALTQKLFNPELELYAGTHVALVRFPCTLITGTVLKAELYLHTVWIDGDKTVPVHGAVHLTENTYWGERTLSWRDAPFVLEGSVKFKALKGDDIRLDVTKMINRALATQSVSNQAHTPHEHGRHNVDVSFRLSATDQRWLKFSSRHAIEEKVRPSLHIKVKGQGKYSANIRLVGML